MNTQHAYIPILIFFIAVVGMSSLVLAPEGDTPPEIDYTNPEQVNSLSPLEVSSAIRAGELMDLTMLNDQNLIDLVEEDPTIMYESDVVFTEVGNRAKTDIQFLNDNFEVREAWFGKIGITIEQNAYVWSYDGTTVKTSGSQHTQFNPLEMGDYLKRNLLQANLKADGSLCIGRSATECAGIGPNNPNEVRTNTASLEIKDNVLSVRDGIVSLDPEHISAALRIVFDSGSKFQIISSNEQKESFTFSSPVPFEVTLVSEGYAVKGNNFLGIIQRGVGKSSSL